MNRFVYCGTGYSYNKFTLIGCNRDIEQYQVTGMIVTNAKKSSSAWDDYQDDLGTSVKKFIKIAKNFGFEIHILSPTYENRPNYLEYKPELEVPLEFKEYRHLIGR